MRNRNLKVSDDYLLLKGGLPVQECFPLMVLLSHM